MKLSSPRGSSIIELSIMLFVLLTFFLGAFDIFRYLSAHAILEEALSRATIESSGTEVDLPGLGQQLQSRAGLVLPITQLVYTTPEIALDSCCATEGPSCLCIAYDPDYDGGARVIVGYQLPMVILSRWDLMKGEAKMLLDGRLAVARVLLRQSAKEADGPEVSNGSILD